MAGTFNCFLNNAFDRQAHNLANTDSAEPCNSPGLVADDLGVSLNPIVHPVHEQAAIPAVGSPAADGWPEADCNIDSGGDLEIDLLGLRRAAGIGACQLIVDQPARAIAIFSDGDLLFLDGFE